MEPQTVLRLGTRDADGKGPVHGAQWLLSGHNVFKIDFQPGSIDGNYGQKTAGATERAKTVLGYPTRLINRDFGPKIRAYLLGTSPLPAAYKRRMMERADDDTYGYPALIRVPLIGYPGQGTHSWTTPPNNWQSDNAWDFAFPLGTDLIAIADGVIGQKIGAISSDPNSRFGGLRFYLECDNGNQAYYAHLSKLLVKAGQRVSKGDRVGLSGAASGVPHLHMGLLRWQEYRPVVEGR